MLINFLETLFLCFYSKEKIYIKRINSTESFIEYESDYE